MESAHLLTHAICFSYRRGNFISKLIAWFTDSSYSHSFIGAPEFLGLPMIYEASFEGVVLSPWRRYLSKYRYEIWFVDAEAEDKAAALEALAKKSIGGGYGFKGVLLLGLSILLRRVGLWWKPPRTANYWCSSLVLDYVMRLPGIRDKFAGLDPELVTPEDLLEVMRGDPVFVRVEISP